MDKVSVFQFDDYRQYLKAVLAEGARKNPSFSLRAFARLTGMSPSHLSRTLNGQKSISASTAHQISLALRQSPEEADHFVGLIELERAKDGLRRQRILKRMTERAPSTNRVVSLEAFQVIADWYHFAILALSKTKGFRSDAHWIGQRLKIKPLQAKLAVERLLSTGFFEKVNGKFKAVNDAEVTTSDDISSAAIRENHAQHLKMAEKALQEVSVELREFNNLTLAMSPEDVPRAKKMIRDFIDKFNRENQRTPRKEVFQLNLQFYPLTETEKEK